MEVLSPSPSQPCDSSTNSSRVLFNPQVKNDLIPKIKQKFDSLDDAKKFYNDYAKSCGFSIRINSSKLGKEGQIIRKEYVCYKEGERSKKNTQLISEKTIRKRGLTREGCGAKMSVVKDKSGGEGYEVIQFFEGHNHPLTTPWRVHLLRSHRGVSVDKKALTQQLAAANVPPSICRSAGNGVAGESIYGVETEDEDFELKHSRKHMLSMVNSGPNTNGSQFFIFTTQSSHLDGKHVVFGKVIKGLEVFRAIENVATVDDCYPSVEVLVVDCGKIPEGANVDSIKVLGNEWYKVLPPPNIPRALHIGHALTAAIQDTIIGWSAWYGTRWKCDTDIRGIQ